MIARRLLAALFGLALASTTASAQIVLPGGGSGGGGGVSSLTTNCPPSGAQTGAVTLNGYLSNQRTVTGTSDTLLSTDCGGIVQYTNSGSIATAIAAAGSSGFPLGYWVGLKNSGPGTVTVTPASSTINGASTLTVAGGTDVQLVVSGSGTFVTMNGANSTVASFSQVVGTFKTLWPPMIAITGSAQAANTVSCAPFVAPLNQHWDQINATILTPSSGGNVQFAIYPDGLNSTSGAHQPVGAATYSSGNISVNAAGTASWALGTGGVGDAIAQGPQWVCLNADNSTVTFSSVSPTNSYITDLIGGLSSPHTGSTTNTVAYTISQTFGTWPTFTTASAFTAANGNTMPFYNYRIATTP